MIELLCAFLYATIVATVWRIRSRVRSEELPWPAVFLWPVWFWVAMLWSASLGLRMWAAQAWQTFPRPRRR